MSEPNIFFACLQRVAKAEAKTRGISVRHTRFIQDMDDGSLFFQGEIKRAGKSRQWRTFSMEIAPIVAKQFGLVAESVA